MIDSGSLHLVYLKWDDPRVVSAWKSFETDGMHPFLRYDYLGYTYRFIRRIKPLYRIRVACVCQGEEILMMVALKGSAIRGYWKMLGDIQGCDVTDALWKPSLTGPEREELTDFFYRSIPLKMSLLRIPTESPMITRAPQQRLVKAEPKIYLRIPVPEDPDVLLKSLQSSVRQNIRTAYNRMNRDGVPYRLEVFDADHPVSDDTWTRIMDLYFTRVFSKYRRHQVRTWWARRKRRRIYYRFKHDTLSLHELPNSFHAVLWSGDRIIAFLSGCKTYDGKRLVVPRLAMDTAFGFYSPGYVLLTEVIRYIAAHPTLQVLDLSRGPEKYKYDMGGQPYTVTDIYLKAGR